LEKIVELSLGCYSVKHSVNENQYNVNPLLHISSLDLIVSSYVSENHPALLVQLAVQLNVSLKRHLKKMLVQQEAK